MSSWVAIIAPLLVLAVPAIALRRRLIEANAEILILGTLDDVWARVIEAHIPDIMPGRGVLPAVIDLTNASHPTWGSAVGQTRTIVLSDKSTMLETVVEAEPPDRLTYRLSDLTGAFRFMVTGATGEFRFEAEGDRVRVRWRYLYQPRSVFTVLAANLIIRTQWQPYMGDVLSRLQPHD